MNSRPLQALCFVLLVLACQAFPLGAVAALELFPQEKPPLFGPGASGENNAHDGSAEVPSGPRKLLGSFGGDPSTGVMGKVFLADVDEASGQALLIAQFNPPDGFYLYSKDLAMTGVNGVGRPTLVELAPSQKSLAREDISTPSPVKMKREGDAIYPHYPAGTVEMALPIFLPKGDHDSNTKIALLLTYMTCEEASGVCLRPVERQELRIEIPNSAMGIEGNWELTDLPEHQQKIDPETQQVDIGDLKIGSWYYPQHVHELKAILAAAEAAGQAAFLDFTGPSCLNCQIMKQTIYPIDSVKNSFDDLVLISINTDPPHADLGNFRLKPTAHLPGHFMCEHKAGITAKLGRVFSARK